jgi:hypothetical protein
LFSAIFKRKSEISSDQATAASERGSDKCMWTCCAELVPDLCC